MEKIHLGWGEFSTSFRYVIRDGTKIIFHMMYGEVIEHERNSAQSCLHEPCCREVGVVDLCQVNNNIPK